MNEIVNKLLLAGDKFMPEMHLKQPAFTYSVCDPFTKNKERIQNFMQTGNTNYIYKNDLDKACFQHDMPYDKYKDLTKRTQSYKVLRDKSFEIPSNPKYDGYQRGLVSMIYKFFDKKSKGSGIKSMPNQQLANEIHKPIFEKFKRRKVYSSFKENIWADQGNEFYENSFKKWLKYNDIEICSTYNEGKSVVAERYIRIFRNRIYKHMTAVSKILF